ncbi:isochorismate synthase [Candidatus Poriferisodalis sp.]|uniref:isochorismate synthase n=1 Tax=Candidatus Poriferisodalis sp. TaxID=3101277 RepID=UPI003B59A043
MRVEDLAMAHSVSVDTVRYYQKIGVLHPPARQGRVAQYDESHERRLGEIRRLSEAGFSLAQIRRLGDGHDDPMLLALGGRHGDTLTFDKLVQQSGLDPELVRLATDTGLVRPLHPSVGGDDASSTTDAGGAADDALYSTGALTMLRAAAELLAAEMPLDDLIGLALRHASNMEAVAADAVGLFADRFADVPAAQRADLAARLIPLVTDLVAQHFREALVEHATERVLAGSDHESAGSTPSVVTVAGPSAPAAAGFRRGASAGLRGTRTLTLECRELPGAPDPLEVFAAAEGSQRVYWACPDDDLEFCALGSVFEASAEAGAGRWVSVAEALGLLDVTVTGDSGHPIGPLLAGGFSFSADPPEAPSAWEAFGTGSLTLPELLLVRQGGRSWLTSAPGASVWPVMAAVHSAADPGLADTAASDLNAAALALLGSSYQADDSYVALVRRALRRIAEGGLDKVVTARELRIASRLEPIAVLDRLRTRYPSCASFAFGRGSQTFFGATPERLVQFDGTRLHTDALAGSRPRYGDPARDRELGAEMQRDPKELTEHAMVVTDVRDTLRACGVALDPPSPTGVMELARIMHLHTPITGRVTAGSTVLELAGALHPTAAVAGLPRRIARHWIEQHEGFDRGWYAAPVGWTTLDGNGEFRVALRCALTGPSESRLFAGGGIVTGADPSAELAETATKLEALLYALEGD